MAFTRMQYTPGDGLKNKEVFPATPVSEDAAREQFQRLFDQVRTQVNALMAALENAQNDMSGARSIGCEPVGFLDDSGESVFSKLEALSARIHAAVTEGLDLSEAIGERGVVTAMIDAGAVTAEKLGEAAVTAEKLAAGAVTQEKLGVIQTLVLGLRPDIGPEAKDTLSYNAETKRMTLSIAGLTPVQLAPVVLGTGASPPAGSYPAGTLYVQYIA